jgi:glycine/D-amino acid oxidase-like deaminating enzyme
MGSSAAYHLKRLRPEIAVAVIEKDPTYEYCSTLRSDGNLRIQFNLEENIRMSQYTMEILDTFATDMEVDGWRPEPTPRRQGNLFLVDAAGREAAEAGFEMQRTLGCNVEWLGVAEIERRYPAYRAEGIVGGVLGPDDGSIDPHAILHGFRRNAVNLGADYLVAEVAAIDVADGRVAGVRLSSADRVEADVVVNCAGGWATPLARTAGIDLPVEPVMRTVFVVDTEIETECLPSIFLPNGVYLLPEGARSFATAWSRPSDPIGFDFRFSRAEFEDAVWPALVGTLPLFDRLTVSGGWTGIYAVNTLDGNAILGEWPDVPGLYLANGFTGHGFQHTPAMGRHIAELISGLPTTLDLRRLGPERVVAGQPLFENAGRII